jgi:hypothetical protein
MNSKVIAGTLSLMALYAVSNSIACSVATAKAGETGETDSGTPPAPDGGVNVPTATVLHTYTATCTEGTLGVGGAKFATHQFVGHTALEVLTSTTILAQISGASGGTPVMPFALGQITGLTADDQGNAYIPCPGSGSANYYNSSPKANQGDAIYTFTFVSPF